VREVWRSRAWYVAEAWHQLTWTVGQLLRPLLVVGWCQASRSHFIEPFTRGGFVGSHSGCESCTWCVECRSLIGRATLEEVEIP
jgi:hypothetical protein